MFIKKEKLIARIKAKLAKAEKEVADYDKKFPEHRAALVKHYKDTAVLIAKAKNFDEIRRWPWKRAPDTPYFNYHLKDQIKEAKKQLNLLDAIVEDQVEVGRFTSKFGLDGMFDD